MRTTRVGFALNGVCPYFTMFPLDFPLRLLKRHARPGEWVLDPFAGRGTTNYASRLLGLPSIGIDSSAVAHALVSAKLANATSDAISRSLSHILDSTDGPSDVPTGEFWKRCYHPQVLRDLCIVREALRRNCRSDARIALRAVILGALHGPLTKGAPSYFSNQCTRTYAPKPRYAVKFWRTTGAYPPRLDIRQLVKTRAVRYYSDEPPAEGYAIKGDSRSGALLRAVAPVRPKWIITSPPYYGMRTYVPDQWLRNWFLGGPSSVDYSVAGQLNHGSAESFAGELRRVWLNIADVASPAARLIVRFGGIADRKVDPVSLFKESLLDTPWSLRTVRAAGTAAAGRRQATHFAIAARAPNAEHDYWAVLT